MTDERPYCGKSEREQSPGGEHIQNSCSSHTCARHGACGLCCTRIEHLQVTSGQTAILDDVNLHIHCGELTAIVGRNGAGKTTLLRAILNAVPHKGTIRFVNGTGLVCEPRIGYVPQRFLVDPGTPVSVADLVISCLSRWPVWLPRKKGHHVLIQTILARTEAENLAKRRLCDLSGGEFQRVMLALAIQPLPDILLLDEPVSGVDRRGLTLFYELVSGLRKAHDMTILLISHDLDIVARHADRVVLIDRTVLAEGTPQKVFNEPVFIETFGHILPDVPDLGDQ